VKRKVDVGAVVSKVFKTYGEYAGVLIGLAAILFLVNALFRFAGDDSVILSLVGALIGIVIGQLYTGMVVELVNDTRDGVLDSSVGGLFKSVLPVLGALIGAAILSGIGITVGLVLCIVPGVFLLTIWAVVSPVIVIERKGVFAAFSRSYELVKGNFWQVLGVIVIFWLITIVITAIAAGIGYSISTVAAVIITWIVGFLLAPLSALASAILYFELRGLAATDASGPATSPPPIAGLPQDPPAPAV
jgi:hypothetical protein